MLRLLADQTEIPHLASIDHATRLWHRYYSIRAFASPALPLDKAFHFYGGIGPTENN
jgi:hypothetical protein